MSTLRSNRRTHHPSRWRIAIGAVVALTLGAVGVEAQSGVVTGQVVSANTGGPLGNVQILIVGANIGTVSDGNGNFRIAGVRPGLREISAQSIGYRPVTQTVQVVEGSAVSVRFELTESAIALDEIVVTALGVERPQREMTTSVQTLSGEELTRAPEGNLVSALSGKISGVHILSSNSPGGSARMVIRGVSSLTGSNQPLWVLDGVPVNNAASTTGTRGYNAIDYGNLIQDLNPNDIASITVLKGPNAAALYGSRAANGAVLITTKKGVRTGGLGMTARVDMTFETPLKLPTYQNVYGQGASGNFQATNDESWGPRMDGQLIVQPLYGPDPAPFLPHPNNVRDFFEMGRTMNTSVSITTGGEDASVRLSLANMNHQGMIPGFGQERTTVSVSAGAGLTDQLRSDVSLQYMNADVTNRPAQGYGEDNVMWQFLWFGRQVDTKMLKARRHNEDGSQYNWNSRWNNNPYWTQLEDRNWDKRDRVIGGGSVTYDIMPWLSLMGRSGTDVSNEHRKRIYAAGTLTVSSPTGAFGENTITRQETNSDVLLSARWPGLEGMTLGGSVGANRRDNAYRSFGSYASQLVVPGLYDLGNAAVPPTMSDYRERVRVNSVYGSASFGFRDVWFVDGTARNDWSSTLPADNNSYFYPSLSTSVILSELAAVPGVSYAKMRLGWAQVGNDAAAYQLVDPYLAASQPFGDQPRFTASTRLRNFDLKPELTESWEVGGELRFLEDRFGIDVTYYNAETSNQIVPVNVTPLTGFTSRMMNAGTISNKGVELMVDATALSLANGLRWDISATYSQNINEVVSLHEGLETLVLDTYYGVTVEARVGEPYGAMYGRLYARDSQGNIVVGANGVPVNTSTNPNGYLGNYNPKWMGGVRNRVRYGPVTAHVLVDGQKGGTIYSMTNRYGHRSGVLIETLQGREEFRTPAEGGGILIQGVRVVSGDTIPNDVVADAQSYWRLLGGIHEAHTYDATYVKLREIRVGLQVPTSWTRRMRVSAAEVALVGRNLRLWTDVPHIDPETAFNSGNVQGFEYSQMPTPRTIGFSVVLTP
jgi:TonB-linked SusC/RagA family outer membrane protein